MVGVSLYSINDGMKRFPGRFLQRVQSGIKFAVETVKKNRM